MKILTIIPAYNEEKAIKEVVRGAQDYSDVLVVDDGSSDQTFSLGEETGAIVLKHQNNKGKGAAIKTGLKYAVKKNYDLIVHLDGDGQHDPRTIPQLIEGMDAVDVRIGSRFLEKTPKNRPLQRRLSNWFTTHFMRYVTGFTITDSQSGFRVISSKSASLFLDIPYDDYVFESEVLFQAYKNNLIVDERPIQCTYNEEKSYVRNWHIFHYVLFILSILMRNSGRKVKI
ncbi:MAG: glycosyltransferase family 2 protein [Methanobacteriaceae archaeon]